MRNIKLKYKGFIGDCQYSTFLNAYNGSIVNANDLITYDATTKRELISEFRRSVDSYINVCASIGFSKLSDPKLFNVSKFFILLEIIKNICNLKYFANVTKVPLKIFTHNDSTCEVNYDKKEKKFSGIIKHGAAKYKIDGRTLRELNDNFVARTSNIVTIRHGRKYIILPRKTEN